MPLIKLEGGEGGKANSQTCPVSNCIHDMCSFPFNISFSYLLSAVEASLDIKKVHMEPNKNNFCSIECVRFVSKIIFLLSKVFASLRI
jgi:hypothetical protein